MKRVAVITGAAGGIGCATAELFQQEGWYVVGVDQQEPGTAGCLDRFCSVDLGDPKAIAQLGRELQELENVSVLVNNAAIQVAKSLADTECDEWDLVMNVNVRAAYLMTRLVSPLMRTQLGAIVNVSSVHAIATSHSMAAYAASKGALLALTRAAALELSEHGIRVNAVLPGAVDTPMLRAGLRRRPEDGGEELGLHALRTKTPLKRVADPREIGEAILFLADNKRASFVTGQALIVDGGATARLSTE